jgi:hypothetical protein
VLARHTDCATPDFEEPANVSSDAAPSSERIALQISTNAEPLGETAPLMAKRPSRKPTLALAAVAMVGLAAWLARGQPEASARIEPGLRAALAQASSPATSTAPTIALPKPHAEPVIVASAVPDTPVKPTPRHRTKPAALKPAASVTASAAPPPEPPPKEKLDYGGIEDEVPF